MTKFQNTIIRIPFIGKVILVAYRAKTALGYFVGPLSNLIKWLFWSKEITNYSYDIEENNKKYLSSLIADILNVEFDTVMTYIREIEKDTELKRHIEDVTANSSLSFLADKEVQYGRRVGWYAFARALKPKTIIETGVEKGLGACVLAAALKRNKEEGYEGKYFGTDNDITAGYLFSGDYADYGSILYGDSIESLTKFGSTIDLFINDSDHSEEYEADEYNTIANKLSEHAIVLGDNSHVTNKLLNFSLKTNRHFIFFPEKPSEHWYPGGGIGISFNR